MIRLTYSFQRIAKEPGSASPSIQVRVWAMTLSLAHTLVFVPSLLPPSQKEKMAKISHLWQTFIFLPPSEMHFAPLMSPPQKLFLVLPLFLYEIQFSYNFLDWNQPFHFKKMARLNHLNGLFPKLLYGYQVVWLTLQYLCRYRVAHWDPYWIVGILLCCSENIPS